MKAKKKEKILEEKLDICKKTFHELKNLITLLNKPLDELAFKVGQDAYLEIAQKSSKNIKNVILRALDELESNLTIKKRKVNLSRFFKSLTSMIKSLCDSQETNFQQLFRENGNEVEELEDIFIDSDPRVLEKIIFNFIYKIIQEKEENYEIKIILEKNNNEFKLLIVWGIEKAININEYVDSLKESELLKNIKDWSNSINIKSGFETRSNNKFVLWFEGLILDYEEDDYSIVHEIREIYEKSEEKKSGNKKARVLVIDDLEDIRELISDDLKGIGYNVTKKESGKDALRYLKKNDVEIIILDAMMPEMNGPQFLGEIKNDNKLKDIPVIVLSASMDKDVKLLCLDLGADLFISKPFEARELISSTKNLISLKAKEKELSNKNKELKENESYLQGILNSLGQGFMIFDKSGIVEENCSAISSVLFDEDPALRPLVDVLDLKDEERDSFSKWLKHVWKGDIPFKDLVALAPQNYERSGLFVSLEYRPIYHRVDQEKKVNKVICIATDRTNEVIVERKMALEKIRMEVIFSLMEDSEGFNDFISTTKDKLEKAIEILKERSLEKNLDTIFRQFHTMKAHFLALNVTDISNSIIEIENFVTKIKKQSNNIEEKNYLQMEVLIQTFQAQLENFLSDNMDILSFFDIGRESFKNVSIEKVKELSSIIKSKKVKTEGIEKYINDNFLNERIDSFFMKYKKKVDDIADSVGKVVNLKIKEGDFMVNREKIKGIIPTFIHLFNNAIVHGIEEQVERSYLGKVNWGTISMLFEEESYKNENCLKISVIDDGQGVDIEALRSRIVKNKILDQKKVKKLSDKKILNLLFEDGVTSKETVDQISGRGVGMGALKEEVINLKGNIDIKSEKGKGTEILIYLPVKEVA
ncbi:MAG: response regulator [Bdellovibrionota bacterium]|nr:response regulator [Bdellovibrionota bacterium]